ncbi:MAG: hypothetical protein EXR69_06710 [Myxococcales bacterium]|nr:hypothetical protein [Myxococcales bacterium]
MCANAGAAAHVDAALEGTPGEALLSSTVAGRGYRGLTYTFSGGLLVTMHRADTPAFDAVASWSGHRFGLIASETRKRMVQLLGSDLTTMSRTQPTRPSHQLKHNEVDALEVNLPDVEHWLANEVDGERSRQKGLAVTETQHTLLSTVLLIREDALLAMSEPDRAILKASARAHHPAG